MNRHLPVLITLALLILLGYPLALLFGLPLALRDRNDLRKWSKETVSADVASGQLDGEIDGENRVFTFPQKNVVENDGARELYLNDTQLTDTSERPQERVDGIQTTFTFESIQGLVVVDGKVLEQGADYTRNGNVVTFATPPPRNAQVRQYRDYFVNSPAKGQVLLAEAPSVGATLWAKQYTVYSRPSCGATVLECFYALPQHPVPFPHWIAARVGPFFSKYALSDERNVVRATLYTTLGTLAALALGGAVGIVLAALFVLFRPLERALLPWTIASQTIPIIALVPVLLLVLGNFGITIQTSLLPTAIIGAYICFFPGRGEHGEGLARRRPARPRPDEILRGDAAASLFQGEVPGSGAVLFHRPQARHRRGVGGCARRRDRVEQPAGLGLSNFGAGAVRQRSRRVDFAHHFGFARHRPSGARVVFAARACPLGAGVRFRPALFVTASVVVALLGMFGPFGAGGATSLAIVGLPGLIVVLAMLVLALVGNVWTLTLVVPLGLLGSFGAVRGLEPLTSSGAWGYWALFWGALLAAIFATGSREPCRRKVGRILFSQTLAPRFATFERTFSAAARLARVSRGLPRAQRDFSERHERL